MSEKGWIKLYRQIQDCSLWVTENPFDDRSAWIDLLLLANHRDKEILFDRKLVTINRGQYLTSVRKLAERWGWSKDKTLRYLRMLEELQMIKRESDNRRTLLTVVNYEIYQGLCDTDEDTHKDTDKDTHKDTHKDTDKPQTRNIRNKELKNERNNIEDNKLSSCSELENSEPPVMQIPLNDNSLFNVTDSMVKEYQELYPAVDVMQQLRNMKGWCLSNPKNRKTRTGVRRFINSWLSREQNRGCSRQQGNAYMDSIKDRVNVVDSWV